MLSVTDNRGFKAKILADSVSPQGDRITTIEATFNRSILSEFNTHRLFSRNSASSRAIPFWKQLQKIAENGYIPTKLGTNKSGMQAASYLHGDKLAKARHVIKLSQDRAILSTVEMVLGETRANELFGDRLSEILINGFSKADYANIVDAVKKFETGLRKGEISEDGDVLNLHKQHVNRYLEPYMWHTVIVTSTDWGNWDALRISPDAQPEIDAIGRLMAYVREHSVPALLLPGEWHLPLIQEDEFHLVEQDIELWKKVSVGRCARVSYETHDGKRDISKDVALATDLLEHGHMSPWEHVATPQDPNNPKDATLGGNFTGWVQLRKTISGEADFSAR